MVPVVVWLQVQVVYNTPYSLGDGTKKRRGDTYRHTTNSTQLLVDTIVQLNIRETLHSRPARPSPIIHPSNAATADTGDRSARDTRTGTGRAPLVEKDTDKLCVFNE